MAGQEEIAAPGVPALVYIKVGPGRNDAGKSRSSLQPQTLLSRAWV